MIANIKTLYFSATGTTEKIVTGIAEVLATTLDCKITQNINFTLPDARKEQVTFAPQDLVVVGVPVYAGRVPNVLLKYLNTITGSGAMAVAVVVYGNRHFDDALMELKDILELDGLTVMAGGAFIGEHSFSKILGANRPDESDMAIALEFARKVSQKVAQNEFESVFVPGSRERKPYFQPKDTEGKPVNMLKVTPKTSSDCIDCKLCVSLCPMGSIDAEDVSKITGICIKCCACIKRCPVGAKQFEDAGFLGHAKEIENSYCSPRREPALFL